MLPEAFEEPRIDDWEDWIQYYADRGIPGICWPDPYEIALSILRGTYGRGQQWDNEAHQCEGFEWQVRERIQRLREIRQADLIEAVTMTLKRHGTPCHWQLIASMVCDQYESLKADEKEVYRALHMNKRRFEAVEPGVYWLVNSRDKPNTE